MIKILKIARTCFKKGLLVNIKQNLKKLNKFNMTLREKVAQFKKLMINNH